MPVASVLFVLFGQITIELVQILFKNSSDLSIDANI